MEIMKKTNPRTAKNDLLILKQEIEELKNN